MAGETVTVVSSGSTVTVTAKVEDLVTDDVVAVAVMIAEPAPTAVTSPVMETMATPVAEEVHATVAFTTFPEASRGSALSWSVWPDFRVPVAPGGGVTTTVASWVEGSVPVAVGASLPPEHEKRRMIPARKPPTRLPETKNMPRFPLSRRAQSPASPMCHMIPLSRITRVVGAAVVVLPALAAAQKPLVLSKPDVEYGEPFTIISGVRELKDGRVLVADIKDKTVQLVDLKGSATKVGREGAGPGEYGLPGRLIPLPGDSTALFDMVNQRYLTIHPDGKPGKDWRLEAATPPAAAAPPAGGGRAGGGGVALGGGRGGGPTFAFAAPRGFDAKGNIYYEGPSFAVGDDGNLMPSDSAPVLRFDRAARRIDTVAYRRVAKANVQASGGRGNQSIRIGGANPLTPQDDWAVLPDGRVAVVRVADYHVDIFSSASRKVSGAPVPYDRIRVDDAVKKMVEAQRAVNARSAVRMSVTAGNNGVQRSASVGGPVGELPPLEDWPDLVPPFQQQAANARPNGEIWVLRTRRPGDDIPTYDVFDASGKIIGRVALPKSHRLVGFGNGTVYLIRIDGDDLQYLQRYKLAMDAKLTG
jgi:hypothetical protein